MPGNWQFTSLDADIAAEFAEFVPERVFDAHAHLYRLRDLPEPPPAFLVEGPANVTPRIWRSRLERQVGAGRVAGGLLMPFPTPGCDVALLNRRLLEDLDHDEMSVGALLIAPETDREELAAALDHPRAAALKPYHCFSPRASTQDSTLEEYLPEWAWRLADERRLAIVLHLVRHGALSDPANQRAIVTTCRRYRNARLQLAHAARGFHAPNTVRGIAAIEGLENVWFDSSGICEAAALAAILRAFGPSRLVFGSDFPVSEIRGRCVTVGDGFVWLYPESLDWQSIHPPVHPTLVGLESLRALREAAQIAGLSRAEVRQIFHGAARDLYATR